MPERFVLHVDMDAFFASVELKRRPELRGKPVIVGGAGDPAKRGVVSAASYEARRYGIASGMPLMTAYRLCPGAVFLPVDFEKYEEVSGEFMEILYCFTPLVESFGLDEAFIEVGEVGEAGEVGEVAEEKGTDPFEKALNMARDIKKRVMEELGLTCSVGIAPNKLLSKLASEMKKPDGLFVIREKDIESTLKDLPVRRLWGVGPRTEKRLKYLGINTVGELASVPRLHLESNFGTIFGRTLYEHSRGIEESPVVPFHEPESISREVTFEEDTSDTYLLKEILYELTKEVVARLRPAGYKARTVTIKVRYSNFETITRSRTLAEPTDSMNDIWTCALGLFKKVEFPRDVRLVGVKVSGLHGAGGKEGKGGK
jgi:DNA polymerase-4